MECAISIYFLYHTAIYYTLLLLLLLDYDCSCHPAKQFGLAMSCWKTTFYIPLRKVVILRVKLLKDAKNPSSLKRKNIILKRCRRVRLDFTSFY
jgi:hypothetical protein